MKDEESPRLALPFIQPAQAQKHVTHNEALQILDLLVQLTVEAFDAEQPPADPLDGQIWALGPSPGAAWIGHAYELAAWAYGGWFFLVPKVGWRAASLDCIKVWTGTAWSAPRVDLVELSGLGINAQHDSGNRLIVSSNATLFNHEGADHRLKINKASGDDTATVLFQSAFSGRAGSCLGVGGNLMAA